MKRVFTMLIAGAVLAACNSKQSDDQSVQGQTAQESLRQEQGADQKKEIADFVPANFEIVEKVTGDLNADGTEDCVLLVKNRITNKRVEDEVGREVDQNEQGIVILFKQEDGYTLAVNNQSCFTTAMETHGNYYAPELSIEVAGGKLVVNYAQGRYGYSMYTFYWKDLDFDLIAYEESNSNGPVVSSEVSIDFVNKKKIVRENKNPLAESGDEVFEETAEDIVDAKAIKLSEINTFENLELI